MIGGGVSEAGDLLLGPGPGGVRERPDRRRLPAAGRDQAGAARPGRGPDRRRRPGPVRLKLRLRSESPARRANRLDDSAVIVVVARPVAHPQDQGHESADERDDGHQRGPVGDVPAEQRRHQQVARPAEQARPGTLGDRIQLRQRLGRRRRRTGRRRSSSSAGVGRGTGAARRTMRARLPGKPCRAMSLAVRRGCPDPPGADSVPPGPSPGSSPGALSPVPSLPGPPSPVRPTSVLPRSAASGPVPVSPAWSSRAAAVPVVRSGRPRPSPCRRPAAAPLPSRSASSSWPPSSRPDLWWPCRGPSGPVSPAGPAVAGPARAGPPGAVSSSPGVAGPGRPGSGRPAGPASPAGPGMLAGPGWPPAAVATPGRPPASGRPSARAGRLRLAGCSARAGCPAGPGPPPFPGSGSGRLGRSVTGPHAPARAAAQPGIHRQVEARDQVAPGRLLAADVPVHVPVSAHYLIPCPIPGPRGCALGRSPGSQ